MRKTDAIRSVASTCWMLFAVTLSLTMVVAPLAAADEVYFDIDANGLDDLGAGWAYEGWLIVDGSPVSTGTFTVDQAGALSRRTFAVAVDDEDGISTFVLTIEPVPDATARLLVTVSQARQGRTFSTRRRVARAWITATASGGSTPLPVRDRP